MLLGYLVDCKCWECNHQCDKHIAYLSEIFVKIHYDGSKQKELKQICKQG